MTTKHFKTLSRLSIPLCLLLTMLLVAPAQIVRSAQVTPTAAAIVVTTTVDDFGGGVGCSLREAIQSANTGSNFGGCTGANASANTITLPAGTYTLTGAAGEDANASGDLDIKGNLTINGADAKTTIIQAGTNATNGVDRVLHVFSSYTVEINDVTIRYGKAPNGFAGASNNTCNGSNGGGIYQSASSTLILNDCVVIDNRTGDGGDGCTSASPSDGRGGLGGGIYTIGKLELNNTRVRENVTGTGGDGPAGGNAHKGGDGGGIYLSSSSTATLTNSTIGYNVTGDGGSGGDGASGGNGGYGGIGGGIYSVSSDLTLIGSTVVSNTTGAGGDGGNASSGVGGAGGYGGSGAGIYGSGTMMVAVDSVISNNQTGLGGSGGSGTTPGAAGLRGNGGGFAPSNGSHATLTECTIGDNSALLGGGLYVYGSGTVVTLDGCTVSGNVADEQAGGISISGGATLALTNSTVSGNRARKDGGGIFNTSGSTTTLTFVTVTGNTADLDNNGSGNGGGIRNTGALTMTNTIVASNYDKGDENPDCSGSITSGDYDLLGIGDSVDCTFTSQPHDLVGTTASPLNPGLALNLEDNGGPTLTHALKNSSPAVAWIPNGVSGCVMGVRDQRGMPRFPPCNIGSYEQDQIEYIYLPLVLRSN